MTPAMPNPSSVRAVSLRDRLNAGGLDARIVDQLVEMPTRSVIVEPRRPFREPGAQRDEVMFVRSGLLSKYKGDGLGRRQIVALRFPGDAILPREGTADYGVQAIIRTEVLIGRAEDFDAIVDSSPELQRFIRKAVDRHASISYEWLVNCGRRDTVARVAHLLCETAERSGIDVRHDSLVNPFTQQHVADITGQTSVNVNRVFADLERQGLIRREGRRIQFSDWQELRRVASFQSSYLD